MASGGYTETSIRRWLAKHDPHLSALKRAVRVAVVMPLNFAIGSVVVGNPQVATLAAFGSFALLLFVEFPGSRSSRAGAYALLAVTGGVCITLGTLTSKPNWLAVVAMAVVAFTILYAGAVSSIVALAGRSALLTFILPVMLIGTPGTIPDRLLGWGIACAISIPAALFIWPPQDQNVLRARTAAMCHALANALALDTTPPGAEDPRVTMQKSVNDLRTAFRASASRPVALSTGSRMLVRLVDELEWLTTTVANACAQAPAQWPEQARKLRATATDVLHSCATVLEHDGSGPPRHCCADLNMQIEALSANRAAVSAETLTELRSASKVPAGAPRRDLPGLDSVPPGEFDRPLYAAHELGYVVDRTARTVSQIAAADSRSWFDRVLGRSASPGVVGEAEAAGRLALVHFDRHSVWLQNSIRGAVGLAAAVLLARISGQQQGFWIVLGALSVLRSNALSTGATALRAVAGTAIGFILGGLLVAAIGTNPDVLWALLPVVVLIAAFTPETISFAAGQAAFTVAIVILYNIIAPAGWRIGVLRIEDVAIGCVAGVIAGALFWPRGAGSALGSAMAEAYWAGADHVREAIDFVTGRRPDAPVMRGDASASGTRLDAALRQYLAEHGAKNVPLESVTALANGASRLRLAGEAILSLRPVQLKAHSDLTAPEAALVEQTRRISTWYHTLGNVLGGSADPIPEVEARSEVSFLDVVLPAIDGCGDPTRAEQAERLLWSGQYVGDVNTLRPDLVTPTGQIRETRSKSAWLR